MEAAMSNPSQWVLVKLFAEVTGYRDSAARHKFENGAGVDSSAITFHVRGCSRRYRRGGTA
jgi:hypothetical protein